MLILTPSAAKEYARQCTRTKPMPLRATREALIDQTSNSDCVWLSRPSRKQTANYSGHSRHWNRFYHRQLLCHQGYNWWQLLTLALTEMASNECSTICVAENFNFTLCSPVWMFPPHLFKSQMMQSPPRLPVTQTLKSLQTARHKIAVWCPGSNAYRPDMDNPVACTKSTNTSDYFQQTHLSTSINRNSC